MNAISKLFTRHILQLLRDLADQYFDEEPSANKEQVNAFLDWLFLQTKDE